MARFNGGAKIMNSERSEHGELRKPYTPTPTKIPWADMVLNICVGCKKDCHWMCYVNDKKSKVAVKYCYARKIMKKRWKRFAEIEGITDHETLQKLKKFEPVMYERRLNMKYPIVPKIIFVNNMGDWHYWTAKAKGVVINDAYDHPQHQFVILSKFETAYDDLRGVSLPENIWLGYTTTSPGALYRYCNNHQLCEESECHHLLNLEPYMSFPLGYWELRHFDAVIIGGITGCPSLVRQYRADFKEVLLKDTINNLVRLNRPFFLKDNLWGYVDQAEYLEWEHSKEYFWNAVRGEK